MEKDMEKLLQYFMRDTEKKFDAVMGELRETREQIGDLQKFKIEMIAQARTVSFVISAICGAITLAASILLTVYTKMGK